MGAGVNLLLGLRCWLYPASIRPSLCCLLCEGELGGLYRGPQMRRKRGVSVMGTGTALPYARKGREEKTWFSEAACNSEKGNSGFMKTDFK